jgi:flagellar protein FliO/FliZ
MKSTLALFGQLAVSLAVVLGLMAVCARLLQRSGLGSGTSRTRSGRRKGHIQVLARQNLTKGTSVAVLEVAGAHLLVGVSDSGVQVLRELDGEALTEPAVEEPTEIQPRPLTFSSFVEVVRERTVRRA